MKTKNGVLFNTPNEISFKKNSSLSIAALGGLTIGLNGQIVSALHSRKAQALLVYLAVTERPQPRELLADLLWEDFSRQNAMNNLRVVLSNLRKHLGDYLLITRYTAAFNLEADYDLDVTALDAYLSFAGELERKTGLLNQESIPWIEQAVEFYKGDFLAGFFIQQAPEFEAWMVVERERLHHLVLDGLGKLVRWELRKGDFTAGIRHASKWVQIEPFSEAAHRQLMRLLMLSGERGAAVIQYEKCQEILAHELGVEPDPKTTALYKQIRDGAIAPGDSATRGVSAAESTQADVHRHNLPVQTTPFVGREIELAKLNQLLKNPGVRLVTVLGAGGMGKTRLALQAGESLLDQFSDGVYFVSLAKLGSEALIVPSIIQALGIEFVGGDRVDGDPQTDLKERLLKNLRRKQMLLILDNFEHLLDGVDLVSEILQAASGVKILATSRARLNLSGEHRFQVSGMDYPEDFKDQDAQQFSAVRLFLQSAWRARTSFKLDPDEMEHIVDICRLVSGMPLSIRLAAAWVETLSPKEIVTEITESIDLLATDLQDIPKRQRSIRALYNHSWGLLSERERDVFQSFSVFRGGCTRDAAKEITGATLRDLRNLVDKSLLHRTLNGRFETHELTREYAAEKLKKNPESFQTMHSNHSIYYNNAVGQWGNDLKSAHQESVLKVMDLEIENARAAWQWAVEHRQVALLDVSMEGFRHYYVIRSLIQEAEKNFHQAAKRLQSGSSAEQLRVYAGLLSLQGYFTYGYESERKKHLYQHSLKLLDCLESLGQEIKYEKAKILNFMGEVSSTSDLDEALRFYKQSLSLFNQSGDYYWVSESLTGLGRTYLLWGKLEQAHQYLQQSLLNLRHFGDRRNIAKTLLIITWLFMRQGRYKQAVSVAQERLEIYEAIGDPSAIADGQAELGACIGLLGDFKKAEVLLEKAMEVHYEMEYFTEFFEDARNLSLTKLELGKYQQAYDLAQYALDWCGERFSTSSERVKGESEMRRIGLTLSNQAMALIALGRLVEAELLLHKSHKALKDIHPATNVVHHHALSGIVALKLGRIDQAKEHIYTGLCKGLEIRSSVAQLIALSAATLLLADQDNLKRAVEIYALAKRYPWIAKSHWNQDVVETPLTSMTISLSPEVIEAIQQLGRERDLEATVKGLLSELG